MTTWTDTLTDVDGTQVDFHVGVPDDFSWGQRGDFGITTTIVANKIIGEPGVTCRFKSQGIPANDASITLDISNPVPVNPNDYGVYLRMEPTGENFSGYRCVWEIATGLVQVYRCATGIDFFIGVALGAGAVVAPTPGTHIFRATRVGLDTITVYIDGVQRLQYIDPVPLPAITDDILNMGIHLMRDVAGSVSILDVSAGDLSIFTTYPGPEPVGIVNFTDPVVAGYVCSGGDPA